jgi:hypothetical protein
MRRVRITGVPPADWVTEAEAVTARLRAAADEKARALIIEENEELWRDDRIRDWLLDQFKNKCWYSEAYESVSSIHVDHYRPKGRVKQAPKANPEAGYWWLAFAWSNYRICGQLLNVKKGDLFPIIQGARCNADDAVSLELEAPALIDPLTDQARLISYEEDEGDCIAVSAGGNNDIEKARAELTIDLMGLNGRSRLRDKRRSFWDKGKSKIADYEQTGQAHALRLVNQAIAIKDLKEMIAYSAEFSSVVEACLIKNAPESLIKAVFRD